jgi:hypothetical protein
VAAYNEQADILQAAGESEQSNMFRAAAQLVAQQIQQLAQAPQQPGSNGNGAGPRPEVQPRQMMESQAGVQPGGLA